MAIRSGRNRKRFCSRVIGVLRNRGGLVHVRDSIQLTKRFTERDDAQSSHEHSSTRHCITPLLVYGAFRISARASSYYVEDERGLRRIHGVSAV